MNIYIQLELFINDNFIKLFIITPFILSIVMGSLHLYFKEGFIAVDILFKTMIPFIIFEIALLCNGLNYSKSNLFSENNIYFDLMSFVMVSWGIFFLASILLMLIVEIMYIKDEKDDLHIMYNLA